MLAGVADLRKLVDAARERRAMYGTRTLLMVDEIHRWNKAQQDGLLPVVEDGTITLIGATTENPYFSIISPLLSRSRIFRFVALTVEEIEGLIVRALHDKERGYGRRDIVLDADALRHLAEFADGDVRSALNALELAVESTSPDEDGTLHITLAVAEESIQRRAMQYDRAGDEHYNTASAFIKSIRGSDVDAAIHYLARMIEAGEDPRFIARRLVISASEDIGLADPQALVIAVAAADAVAFIGMPEGRIPLAEATPTSPPRPSPTARAPIGRPGPTWRSTGTSRRRCTSAIRTRSWARSVGPPRATSTRTTTRAVGWPSAICPRALREAGTSPSRSVMRSESPSLCGSCAKSVDPLPTSQSRGMIRVNTRLG